MKPLVTLYLADDHQIVIDGLKLLISTEESIKIVGYATDGNTACAEIKIKRPTLALIDFSMPGLNGLELINTLRKVVPDTKFIVLSMHDKQNYIKDVMNSGASGYLLKNIGKAELMKCLSVVLDGGTYFPNYKSGRDNLNKSVFTPKELEVIKLILDEHTSGKIAQMLCISHHTVDVHRKKIMNKAGAKSLLGLSRFIQENQIKV